MNNLLGILGILFIVAMILIALITIRYKKNQYVSYNGGDGYSSTLENNKNSNEHLENILETLKEKALMSEYNKKSLNNELNTSPESESEISKDSIRHIPHIMGKALNTYARTLGTEHIITLTQNRKYGGAAAVKIVPLKPWQQYESWNALQKDEGAKNEYLEQRLAVLNNPNLDWAPVLAEMQPKLLENREYIGIVNLDSDGKTLRIVASEPSPFEAGEETTETEFAGIPISLVEKYASRPGLFLFHTHPADLQCSPLPSSADLSAAIYFGATTRFAACAVISRYGVLVHGLDWDGYKSINDAKDWKLAVLNLCHDIVAAHEAIRSWTKYTIADYINFYPRHRLLLFVYPSNEMIGDARRYTYKANIELPIDYELLSTHIKDIVSHRTKVKKTGIQTKSTIISVEPFDHPIILD